METQVFQNVLTTLVSCEKEIILTFNRFVCISLNSKGPSLQVKNVSARSGLQVITICRFRAVTRRIIYYVCTETSGK